MKPSTALNLQRAAVRAAASRYRTANPRVFGSVLRGTDEEGSDLDLLVEAQPGATLFDLGGVQVDVLTAEDLPVKFRAQVLQEARPV